MSAGLLAARAVGLGERIDLAGLDPGDAISRTPLAFRTANGLVVVFRYGVVVLLGVPRDTEAKMLEDLLPRVAGAALLREEESILVRTDGSAEGAGADIIGADGVVRLADGGPERLLLVAEALAKSVALAQDERRVAQVLDRVEPWAQGLATRGRHPSGRREVVRQIGGALLMQLRLSERVAAREKPDLLWDHPELERLYVRLAAEFELAERAEALDRRLKLVGEAVEVLADFIDTERSLRLEIAVVALIIAEAGIMLSEMLLR